MDLILYSDVMDHAGITLDRSPWFRGRVSFAGVGQSWGDGALLQRSKLTHPDLHLNRQIVIENMGELIGLYVSLR
jgi:hypothetical protein